MNVTEYLLGSTQISQQYSACLWDHNTLNIKKHYKNGGTVAPKCLECLGEDYILSAEIGKPLLHVWPLNSQDVAKNIRLILPEPATCLAVCPQSNYLAVGISSKLFIWQLASGKLLSVQQKHFQPITTIKFSSDSDFLLIGGQDGILVAYLVGDVVSVIKNFMEQSEVGQAEPLFIKNDHSMPITDIHIGSFGHKSRFCSVSSDHTCRIYNLKDGDHLLTLVFNDILSSVIIDPPFWYLFVGSESGGIKQFRITSATSSTSHVNEKTSLSFIGHKKKIVCLAINATNTILASGSEDNFILTWEIKSRQILKKIEQKSPITNIKFVPDYSNFFIERFKPEIVLKSLQRFHDGNTDFIVSKLQMEDMELDEDNTIRNLSEEKEFLLQENQRLRSINKQVYQVALSIKRGK